MKKYRIFKNGTHLLSWEPIKSNFWQSHWEYEIVSMFSPSHNDFLPCNIRIFSKTIVLSYFSIVGWFLVVSLNFLGQKLTLFVNFRNLLCKFLMFYCIITVIISKYCMKKLIFLTFLDMKGVSLGSIDWGCKSPRPKNANLKSQYDYAKKKWVQLHSLHPP